MNQEMVERWGGEDRRFYNYAIYIPERRSGDQRSCEGSRCPDRVERSGLDPVYFCPECRAEVPVWAAECLECGCVWD